MRALVLRGGRRFQHALQRQQALSPQLDLLSRQPYVVTFRNRFLLKRDAELILLDPPFSAPVLPIDMLLTVPFRS
jgi:hypothetical protein